MESALGERNKISIFGKDYPTKDGTCVRDYIHVSDLASAHLDTLGYIEREKKNLSINLGTGCGHSVLDIVNKVQKVCNVSIKYDFEGRRLGDPDTLCCELEIS